MQQAVARLQDAAPVEDPTVVLDVTQRAIAAALKVIMRADDSSGIIGDAVRGLLDLHPQVAARAKAPYPRLVDWMIRFQFDEDCDFLTLDPVAYAPALGDLGVAAYRARLDQQRAALGTPPPIGARWESPHAHDWFTLDWNAQRLAVLDRDVEAIITTHARDRRVAAWLEDTSEALEEIGEVDLAIDWAKQATDFDHGHQSRKAADRWCRLLAEHRPDELLPARREVFRRWPEPAPAGRRSRAGSAHRCRSGCPSRSRTTWPRSLGPRDVRRRRSPDRPSPSTWTATAAPDPNRPAGERRPSSPNRHLCELGDLGYELGPRRPPHRPSPPYPSARACYPGVKVARLHVWRAGTTRARRGFGPRIDTVPACWSAIYATSWTCPTTRRARRRLAEHLGSIVRAGTAGDVGPAWQTALPTNGAQVGGPARAAYRGPPARWLIRWQCSSCGDAGVPGSTCAAAGWPSPRPPPTSCSPVRSRQGCVTCVWSTGAVSGSCSRSARTTNRWSSARPPRTWRS